MTRRFFLAPTLALTAIAGVAAGPWLLTAVAVGFAAFGVYALARARYPDRDPSS